MDNSGVVLLIPVVYTDGPYNQKQPQEQEPVKLFCTEKSVSRSEWSEAARTGLKAEYKLIICTGEYHGETLALYKGQKFTIYRTYNLPESDDMEIYLARRLST